MDNIRLKPFYSIIAHGPDIVELRHGVWNATSFTLTDENGEGTLYRLLRRLDGSLSPAEIARAERRPKTDVEALIDHLTQLGVVEAGASTALDYYVAEMIPVLSGRDGQLAKNPAEYRPILLLGDPHLTDEVHRVLSPSLPNTEVDVVDRSSDEWRMLGAIEDEWLLDGADFARVLEMFRPWSQRLLVMITETLNPIMLRNLNRICVALKTPWINGAVDGPFLLVGPVMVPNRTACYECLDARVTMNLRAGTSYQQYKSALVEREIKHGELAIQPALRAALGAHVAIEVLNFTLTDCSFTLGKVLAIYLPTMEFSYNEVLRVPGCPACGVVSETDEEQLYFDIRALYES